MMRINNLVFIPFVMPFVIVVMARAVFWLAGAGWDEATGGFVGAASIIGGLVFGAAAAAIAGEVDENILGHTTIGRKRAAEERGEGEQ